MSNTSQQKALVVSHNVISLKCFLWACLVLSFLCAGYTTTQAVTPVINITSPSKRYEEAKKILKTLQADTTKRNIREHWLKLSETFFTIYKNHSEWINAPFAIYYSGVALEELAKYSASPIDSKKAIERYESLVRLYPKRTITESALLNIAKIYIEQLKNPTKGQSYLKKLITQYPKSEKNAEANIYLKKIVPEKKEHKTTSSQKIEPTKTTATNVPIQKNTVEKSSAQLDSITWEVHKDKLKLILTLNTPIQWSVLSQPSNTKTGRPTRLLVELHKTTPSKNIKPGIYIKQSKLEKLRVDLSTPGLTRILLDFSALNIFKVETATNPFRLIIYTSTIPGCFPNGMKPGQSKHSKVPTIITQPQKTHNTHNQNLAQQLGLSVKTVLIDAGHGGKDPGATHNGIIESELTLELAKHLGKLLSQKGLNVHYTRTNNIWVALGARSRKANTIKADLMISIHINASENTQAHGFETYYLDFSKSSEATRLACVENATSERTLGELELLLADVMLGARNQESRKLAESVQRNVIIHLLQKNYKARDGGIKSAPFHVLMGSRMPGILIEVGYCSNKAEAQRLVSNKYRTALAEGIAKGILAYSGKLQNP